MDRSPGPEIEPYEEVTLTTVSRLSEYLVRGYQCFGGQATEAIHHTG